MLAVGSPAPEIAAADLGGEFHSLSSTLAASGPVLLAFFKVSCPTCQFTFPFLQRFADRGFQVIGVSQDGAAATEAFRDRFELQFPLWLDPAGAGYPASTAYRITHVPSLFLVSADGSIEQAFAGFSRQDLESLGERKQFVPFGPAEAIPAFRPG